MRTYLCSSCNKSITVGHPRSVFKRRALALAAEAYSLIQRLFHRGKIARKLLSAMEERYYLEPHHYRSLPNACPRCGFRSKGELPWWRPGVAFPDAD